MNPEILRNHIIQFYFPPIIDDLETHRRAIVEMQRYTNVRYAFAMQIEKWSFGEEMNREVRNAESNLLKMAYRHFINCERLAIMPDMQSMIDVELYDGDKLMTAMDTMCFEATLKHNGFEISSQSYIPDGAGMDSLILSSQDVRKSLIEKIQNAADWMQRVRQLEGIPYASEKDYLGHELRSLLYVGRTK